MNKAVIKGKLILCKNEAINEIKYDINTSVSLSRVLRRILEDGEVSKSDLWALSDVLVEKMEEIAYRLSLIDSDF